MALIDDLTSDFRRLQKQKARKNGGVEGRVLQNLAFVFDEHYTTYREGGLFSEPREANKLYLMFNLIGPRLGKLLGRLSSIAPSFKAQPDRRDPQALEESEIVDRLIIALDDKLVQPSVTWEILWWMAVGGVAFEYTPWVPNVTVEPVPQYDPNGELLFKMADQTQTGPNGSSSPLTVPESQMGQMVDAGMAPRESFDVHEEIMPVGDVGSEVLGPLNVFIDHGVKSVKDLSPDQKVYIAKIRTTGWIEENFGVKVDGQKNLSIVSSQFHHADDGSGGFFLKDLIPIVQGSVGEDDPPMAVVVEAYTPSSGQNPRGRYEVFIPGDQIIYADDNPYENIPITDFHWKPVTTTFWTQGYIEPLIPPQRFINKRVSQLGEQSNATLYSQLLLGGSLTPDDIPADYPGAIKGGLGENGMPLVSRLAPPELPTWFLASLQAVTQMFNDIAGGSDLFEESKFPGQMRGPMAVPMLQEILDTEWGPLYMHIGERMARVKQQRLDRVKQFYPPQRTMHYTDRDQKDEVLVFHADKVLRGGISYNVRVERGELVPELRALREARVRERLESPLAILYMNDRTGQIDKSKIAEDLKFGETGRDSRESQYRKLGSEIVEMLWQGKQIPPVLPFYDHSTMMDELEAAMATTEYLKASPPIQFAFTQRWEGHRQYIMQAAQQQAQAMQATLTHSAVAQATQQAAAEAASQAVNQAMTQAQAQKDQPTGAFIAGAQGQQPQQAQPPTRTITVKQQG